jgi:hypothetical protein
MYRVLWQNIDSFTDFAKYGYAAGNVCLEKWGAELGMSRYLVVAVDRSAATFLSIFASIPSGYMLPLSHCHALLNCVQDADTSLSCPVPSRLRNITTPAVLVKIHENG